MFRYILTRRTRWYGPHTRAVRHRIPANHRTPILPVIAVLTAVTGCVNGNADRNDIGSANTDDGNASVTAETDVLSRVSEHPTDQTNHVLSEVTYETKPPTGGDHFPYWQNCDFYTEPLIDEVAVHSLEHGAVWVTYKPDIDEATLDAIKEKTASDTHLMASPYPGLESPIVLSAWERQITVQVWEDPAVDAFIHRYRGRRSPTAPEAGAPCSEAIGKSDDPAFHYEEAVDAFRQSNT